MLVTEVPALTPGALPRTTSRRTRQRLSLVLPAHNEQSVIRQAIREAADALTALDIDFEIIVVDDGSTDETNSAALEAARGCLQVRVVTLPENVGYAAALRRGFREARYEWVAFTDADCQFDLNDLGQMLPLTECADVVCGFRRDRQDHWRRKVYSKGFNLLARVLLGTGVRDCDCALKIFRRDWVNSAELNCEGFFFNAELLARARQEGLRIVERGVTHRPRQAGESKVSIRHVLPVLCTLIRFWWSQVLFTQPGGPRTESAPHSGRQTLVAGVVLAFVAAFAILPKLSFPLLDPDETRYAQIAREMVESGDLIVPTRHGLPYLDKPPLLYWLTAASFALFGVSEWAARLVTAGAAVATVLSTFWLGRALVGVRAAWVGAFLQLMCIGFVLSGRFLYMDSLLTFFTTVSLLAGYSASRDGEFRPWPWCMGAAACGLGILTKGPVAPVLCVPPLVASCWLTGRWLKPRHWLAYAAIAAGIALPWFLAVAIREPEFLEGFLFTHHLERFVGGLNHEEPMWFYLPILLIGMLPTSILLPAVVAFYSRGADAGRQRTWDVGYLLLFAGWTLALFSVSRCKLPPYILPVLPAICLICGKALAGIIATRQPLRFLAYVRDNSPRDLCVILCLGIPVAGTVDWILLPDNVSTRFVQYGALATSGVLVVIALSRGLVARTFPRWGMAAVFALFVLSYGAKDLTPALAAKRWKIFPVEQLCAGQIEQSTPIICFALRQEEDAFTFYFHRQRVSTYEWNQVASAISALKDSPHTLLFANVNRLKVLKSLLPPSVRVIELGRHEHIVVSRVDVQNDDADIAPGSAVSSLDSVGDVMGVATEARIETGRATATLSMGWRGR